MPKKLNRGPDGKVAGENLSGQPLPKRGSLKNETTGKAAGSRQRLRVGSSMVNYARRGR